MADDRDKLFNLLIRNAEWPSEDECWRIVDLIREQYQIGLFYCEGCKQYKEDVIEFKDGFYCTDCSYGDYE